jgi:hypothetical protein
MKINIDITYNGRSYNSIADAARQAIIDGIKESIENDLAPFADEIAAQGGKVVIDLDENYQGELNITGIDTDLKNRIEAHL